MASENGLLKIAYQTLPQKVLKQVSHKMPEIHVKKKEVFEKLKQNVKIITAKLYVNNEPVDVIISKSTLQKSIRLASKNQNPTQNTPPMEMFEPPNQHGGRPKNPTTSKPPPRNYMITAKMLAIRNAKRQLQQAKRNKLASNML